MRLFLIPAVSILSIYAAPARSAILPLAEAQQVRDPQTPVAETDVDKATYDERGRPVPRERTASSVPRRSLGENLKVRLRRGYTLALEPGEVIAIEQAPVGHRIAREDFTISAFGEIANGSLSAGDPLRVHPLASAFQPLWVAVVPSTVIDPATGQMVTVLLGVVGPSVGQNGFLSPVAGDTVLADSLIAPVPTTSVPSRSLELSTPQDLRSFVALPSRTDSENNASDPQTLLVSNEDAEADNAAPSADMVINTAVPEPSTWAMMLLGFAALICVPRTRKTGRHA